MRTFIALEPSAELRTRLARLCRELQPLFPGVRWSRMDNIHLTLRFLGEIDASDLEPLIQAVSDVAAKASRPALRAGRAGWFGSPREPRVVWLGLQDNKELEALAGAIETSLLAAGFGAADKPFKAHLTLARPKKALPRPVDRAALERLTGEDWPLWEPRQVLIIKSTLLPEGPRYETLAALPIGGAVD